jgi:hypothetical protein
MWQQLIQKSHNRVIVIWLVLFFIIYIFLFQNPTISLDVVPTQNTIDAIVFITMGKLSSNPLVDYSVASVRKLGKFHGPIYILTDSPQCFVDTSDSFNIDVIEIPALSSLMEIKALKTKLFSFLPQKVKSILYFDVDILVMKNLEGFIRDLSLSQTTISPAQYNELRRSKNMSTFSSMGMSFGAFLDAKGNNIIFHVKIDLYQSALH